MSTIRIKTGDTSPLTYVIQNADNTPVDLKDTTVTVTIGSLVTNGECTIDEDITGQITYDWGIDPDAEPDPDDEPIDITDTPGMYPMVFRITDKSGMVKSLPVNESLWLFIMT